MAVLEWRDYAVLVVYFLLMSGIGVACMRLIKAQEDYFMGGRGFGKLLQTFAAFGAGTGSSDPVNAARTSFTSGLSGMWSVMYWLWVTPFYWITGVWYRRMRHLTLGDWFVERYESKALGATYAVAGVLFFMVYGSMLFSAIGKVTAPLVGRDTVSIAGMEMGLEYILVPIIAVLVLVYGILGGLRAAYWTDLIQGMCIILLSILLIPYGLTALVEKFGDPATDGMMDGFRIMHEQLPPEYFSVLGSTSSSDFTLSFLVVVVLMNLVGIVVQPHMIATGGGSAKTETNARVGLVTGNFLKRLCTVGWVLTALIALALFADSPELAGDPDRTWGVASRELLMPGLKGLMLACLLAALMSSVDAQMIVGSALVARNIYAAYINPNASERGYVMVGRLVGPLIVVGAVVFSIIIMDVFVQLQITWRVPLMVAAPFWIGMYWRRATRAAACTTIVFCLLFFFIIPWTVPLVVPGLRDVPRFTKVSDRIERTSSRIAAPSDVARRAAAIRLWEKRYEEILQNEDKAERQAGLKKLGERPAKWELGQKISELKVQGGTPIYWTKGVEAVDDNGNSSPDVKPRPIGEPEVTDQNTTVVTLRYPPDTRLRGEGFYFRTDFLVYDLLGVDLERMNDSTLKALELPPIIITPFVVMILVSLVTRRNSQEALDRYYVKMKTPVIPDPEEDRRELDESYASPRRFDHRKLFPGTDLEIQKPRPSDLIGFVVCMGICVAIVALAVWAANIGAPGDRI